MLEREKRELELAGFFDKDGLYTGALGAGILELLQVLKEQGHSGTSAEITASVFKFLVDGLPLTPLQGTEDEWTVYGPDFCDQNNRCYSVFREKDGKYTYAEALVFKDEHGDCFIGTAKLGDEFIPSSTYINFPFTPKSFYIDVYDAQDYFIIKDPKQVEEALNYFKN